MPDDMLRTEQTQTAVMEILRWYGTAIQFTGSTIWDIVNPFMERSTVWLYVGYGFRKGDIEYMLSVMVISRLTVWEATPTHFTLKCVARCIIHRLNPLGGEAVVSSRHLVPLGDSETHIDRLSRIQTQRSKTRVTLLEAPRRSI